MSVKGVIISGTTVTALVAILLFEVFPLKAIETNVALMTSTFRGKTTVDYTNPGYLTPHMVCKHRHIIAVLTPVNNGMRMARKKNSSLSRYPNVASDKSKLTHSSFRIDEGVIKALKETSEIRQTSLSNLVNMTLKNYITSQMYFQELGFIPVSKHFLRRLFSRMSLSHLNSFGKEVGMIVAAEYISYFFPKVSSTIMPEFLEIWLGRFQSCQHTFDAVDNCHIFYVTHEINLNFSLAIKYMLKALIEPITKTRVEFRELTSDVIIFSFEVQA